MKKEGYLVFNVDGTITTEPYEGLNIHKIPEGVYFYSFYAKKWFIRITTEHSYWRDKQPEDVPKQHRAALLIYS